MKKTTIGTLVHEVVDFLLVVLFVGILGIMIMYFDVIKLSVQDHLVDTDDIKSPIIFAEANEVDAPKTQLLVQSQDFENDVDIQGALDSLVHGSEYSMERTDLGDFLEAKIGGYEFAFNELPPGRKLTVASLGIEAPIVDVPYASEQKIKDGAFEDELREGVVKYPGTAEIGQEGNSLLFGHSSVTSREAAQNEFGHIFRKLPDMTAGEKFQVIRDGQVHSFVVEEKEIIQPEEVADKVEEYDLRGQEYVTLMACYPLFSTAQRIVLVAKKVDATQPAYGNIFVG